MEHNFELTQQVKIQSKPIIDGWVAVSVRIGKNKPEYDIITQDMWDKSSRAKTYQKNTYKTKSIPRPYLIGKTLKKCSHGIFNKKISDYDVWPVVLNNDMVKYYQETGEWFATKFNPHTQNVNDIIKNGIKDGFDLYFVSHFDNTMYDKNMVLVHAPYRDFVCSSSYRMKKVYKAIEKGKLLQFGDEYYVRGNGESLNIGISRTKEQHQEYLERTFDNYGGLLAELNHIGLGKLYKNE